MASSPDRRFQGIEHTSSSRGSEEFSQFYTTRGSSSSNESLTSDIKGAASVDGNSPKYTSTCSKPFDPTSGLRTHIDPRTSASRSPPFRGRDMDRHYCYHTSPELSRARHIEPPQNRRQAHDSDFAFGPSGQPQPHPFNNLDYHYPHQDSKHHIPRTLKSKSSDDLEDDQNHRSLTNYHHCNDDYRHPRHLPVSRSHVPHSPSRSENEDTHIAFQSRKSHLHSRAHISMLSSPSQSDTDFRLDVNVAMSPRKRRRMNTNPPSEPSPSPPSSSYDNMFNMSAVTSNSVPFSVDYPVHHSSLDSLPSDSLGSFPAALVNFPVYKFHDSPSPPNTGNWTTSNPPFNIGRDNHSSSSQSHSDIEQGPDSANQTYSFVAVKKKHRRYDEIERLYSCSWPNCTKAYGTLNHLNAHITMQKHGPKRSPSEFMELRKQWRKAKKEAEGSHPVSTPGRQSDNTRLNDPNMYGPACKTGSSSPNAQFNNGSNLNGMGKTCSNWASSVATNENLSRPGSPKSGSSSVSDFSQSSSFFPSPSYNRYSSSPNNQSSTSYNRSSSKGMANKFSNWSNYPSPAAANKNSSRPGSAQSGSSGGRSDSP